MVPKKGGSTREITITRKGIKWERGIHGQTKCKESKKEKEIKKSN